MIVALMILHVAAFLCDDATHAVQFATRVAAGDEEEIAADFVGRTAGKQVCGFYAGDAVIESQTLIVGAGVLYRLTAFRFAEDHRLAWVAEPEFAPAGSAAPQDL